MFADLELIGIPHRITIGDRGLKQGQVEYQSRREGKPQMVEVAQAAGVCQGLGLRPHDLETAEQIFRADLGNRYCLMPSKSRIPRCVCCPRDSPPLPSPLPQGEREFPSMPRDGKGRSVAALAGAVLLAVAPALVWAGAQQLRAARSQRAGVAALGGLRPRQPAPGVRILRRGDGMARRDVHPARQAHPRSADAPGLPHHGAVRSQARRPRPPARARA